MCRAFNARIFFQVLHFEESCDYDILNIDCLLRGGILLTLDLYAYLCHNTHNYGKFESHI